MKRKLLTAVLAATVLTGVLAGCGKAKPKDNAPINVAYFPNITHAQALDGKNSGKFQDVVGKDNKIEWKQFNAGSSEVEALLAKEVDLGYIGPVPAVNAYSKTKGDVVIIAGATDAGAILVAGKDSGITSVKDLAGKKVAIPQFGNTQDLSLRNLLKENGLKDTTKGGNVEVVQAENPDIKTLLDKKEIAAALVPEPWGTRLIKESGAKVVLDYKELWRNGEYPTAVIVARKDFIKDHRELVKNFLKAHVELTQDIIKNKDANTDIINKELKALTQKDLAKDVLDGAFSRLTTTYVPQKDAISDFVNLSVENGFLKEKPDTSNLYDLSILNEVLKEKNLKTID